MNLLSDILRKVVSYAVGCTEPGAIALATAAAREAIGGTAEQINVIVDPNTFKNALVVIIPNTGGRFGIPIAAALGAVCGDPKLELQIFKDVSCENTKIAEQMVQQGRVQVCLQVEQLGLYIDASVKTPRGMGRVVIKDSHTNIIFPEANGVVKVGDEATIATKSQKGVAYPKLLGLKIPEIIHLTADIESEDIQFLLKGAEMNMTIAEAGIAGRLGLAVGANFKDMIEKRLISHDLVNDAKMLVAGAVDARMSGSSLSVTTNSQSGNQGIATTIPIVVASKKTRSDQLEVARALALGHLFAAYTRLKIGELSTICGSAVASAIGAGVGILWLIDKREELVARVVKNIFANIGGGLCGGANGACALKLATASGVAVETAFMVSQSAEIDARHGIIADSAEKTFDNLALISESMRETELVILGLIRK